MATRGYDSQVGARAQDVAVQVSPEAYGAGLGRSIGEAGQVFHQGQINDYKIQRAATADAEATGFARRFAEFRLSMDETVRATRNSAAPGGVGHTEAMRQAYEKGRETLFTGLTEDSVKRQAEQQFIAFGSSLLERESTWAEGRRVAKVLDDAQVYSDIGANRVRALPDANVYQDESALADAYIDSLNLDDDTRAKLKRETHQKYAISFLNGRIDQDPAVARGLIDAGAFNDVLEPQQLEQLRSGADVEIRRGQAQAEHEANMQKAGIREQIATLKEADSQGLEVDPARIDQLIQAATAMGDTSAALELDGIKANNAFARVYRAMTPVQREARISVLSGKEKRSPAEQRELEYARTHAGAMDSDFNNDPVGYAAKYGTGSSVPPVLDPADPQSVAKRLEWRRQYSAATGRPVPVFSDNELVPLRERVTSGAPGRLEVLKALDAMPSADRAEAARQILPNDVSFRHESLIRPFARATVYAGREKLAADRSFLTPDRKTPAGQRAHQLLGIAGSEIDFALRAMQPAEVDAVKQISGQWLAGWLSAKGRDINSLTPGDIRNAATLALGGYAKPNGTYLGGIGHWAGGQPYVVPDGFNHNGFQTFVMGQRKLDDGRGNGPINPDGTPFNLNNAYPVLIGPDRYRWETPGGSVVTNKKGQAYVTRLYRTGRAQ